MVLNRDFVAFCTKNREATFVSGSLIKVLGNVYNISNFQWHNLLYDSYEFGGGVPLWF